MSTGEITYGTDLYGSTATGGSVTLGQTTFGWVSELGGDTGDQDWYLARLQAGVGYTLHVAGADLGGAVLPDAFLEVYDLDGDLILSVSPDALGEISYTFTPMNRNTSISTSGG